MDTTIDEARRCAKCGELGEKTKEEHLPRGRGKEITFTCRNDRCRWHDQTCSVVTVRPDGSIPEPKLRTKMFSKIPDKTEQVQAMLDAQLNAEMTGRNNEIRNR